MSQFQVEPVGTIPFTQLPSDYPCSAGPDTCYPSSHWLEMSGDGEGLSPRTNIRLFRITCQGEASPLYVIQENTSIVWFVLGNTRFGWDEDAWKMEGHFAFQLSLTEAMRTALVAVCEQRGWWILGTY